MAENSEPTKEPGAGRKPRKRGSRTAVQARTTEVVRLLLQSATIADLVEFSEAQGWNLSLAQLKRYAAVARKKIEAMADEQRGDLFKHHVAQLRFLHTRACTTGDVRGAVAILDRLAELYSLVPPRPGTFPAEAVLAAFNSVDKLVGDLLQDEAQFGQYRQEMRLILTSLQASASSR